MNPNQNLLEGQLEGTGLAELLGWITSLSASGRLLLRSGHEQMTLGLADGAVVSARSSKVLDPDDRVGTMLVETGLVDAAVIEALAAEQRADARRIGEILVDAGEIHPEQLDELLELQIYLRVQRIRGWKTFHYVFRGAGVDARRFVGLPFDIALGKVDGLSAPVRALHRKLEGLRRRAVGGFTKAPSITGAILGLWGRD